LNEGHTLAGFVSGEPALDDWLRRRALPNQASGASRTFVVSDAGRVVGFYAIASHGIALQDVTGRFRRNMPDPVPVALLARLAVDAAYQGQGLGRALFRDAAMRVVNAADLIGVRGIVVHALSKQAKGFYQSLGLEPSPISPMTLMATLQDLRAWLGLPAELGV
jgi:GNAT superfamily N-acetyltransferase